MTVVQAPSRVAEEALLEPALFLQPVDNSLQPGLLRGLQPFEYDLGNDRVHVLVGCRVGTCSIGPGYALDSLPSLLAGFVAVSLVALLLLQCGWIGCAAVVASIMGHQPYIFKLLQLGQVIDHRQDLLNVSLDELLVFP